MANQNEPLDESHLVEIDKSLKQLGEAKLQIEKAKRAGIDLGTAEADLFDNEGKLMKIRQAYFPGKPLPR